MTRSSTGWLENALMALTVCALIARISSVLPTRADLLYCYPAILLALLAAPSLVRHRPNSAYAFCRRHPAPASSLLLSSCLLPSVFACHSLLTHTYQGKDYTQLAFYLTAASSLLAHLSLALSPDLRLLRRPATLPIIAVLALLPVLIPRLHFYALQSTFTLVTLGWMAALVTALQAGMAGSFTVCELLVVCNLLALLLGHLTVVLGVSLLVAHRFAFPEAIYIAAELPSAPALLLIEVAIALALLLFLMPPRTICLPPAIPDASVSPTASTSTSTPSSSSAAVTGAPLVLDFGYIVVRLSVFGFFVVYPLVWTVMPMEPVAYIVQFMLHTATPSPLFARFLPLPTYLTTHPRLLLAFYWSVLLATLLPLAPTTTPSPHWPRTLPTTVIRKYYHLLATLLFLPGLLVDHTFTCIASGGAFLLFLVVEYVRMHGLQPLAPHIAAFVGQYLDGRDEGPIILTHLYLLVGCVLTGGLHGILLDAPHHVHVAGVYVLGVMDAMASVVGCSMGRHSWEALLSKGTSSGGGGKTVEGTVGGVLSVVVMHLCVLNVVGWDRLTAAGFVRWCLATGAVGLMEAWTSQIDNLVLPLFYYVAWIVAVVDPSNAYTIVDDSDVRAGTYAPIPE